MRQGAEIETLGENVQPLDAHESAGAVGKVVESSVRAKSRCYLAECGTCQHRILAGPLFGPFQRCSLWRAASVRQANQAESYIREKGC